MDFMALYKWKLLLLVGSAERDEFEQSAPGRTATGGMGRHAAARHGAHALHQSMAMTLGWHDTFPE